MSPSPPRLGKSDRRPDQAIYLHLKPEGPGDLVSMDSPDYRRGHDGRGTEYSDYEMKRVEYLLAGVLEYWIFGSQVAKCARPRPDG